MSSRRTTILMLHMLNAYPRMMTRHDNPPPFIHPMSVTLEQEYMHLEPLNNCMSLVHMVNSGIQGSRKLFWKNVRMECERFCSEAS